MRDEIVDTLSASIGDMLAAEDSGTKVPAVTCTIEHILEPEHIAEYVAAHGSLTTTEKSDQKDVGVLRARHHSVARLLAAGLPEGIVADLTNFTSSYISTLKGSPSMLELITHYRAPGNAQAEAIAERLRTVGHAAVERLSSRIEELDDNALLALAKLGLDRSGHGPQSTQHNITEHRIIDLAEVARLSLDARQKDRERIVDIQAVRQALPKRTEDGDEALS